MGNKHILVIETDPDDAYLLSRALKTLLSCTYFLCRSLSEAKAYLSRAGIFADTKEYPVPDAVITELRLGAESVYQLLRWMRGNEPFHPLPLYILTSAISPADRENMKTLGIKRVVEKPSGLTEMKRVLSELATVVCSAT